LQPLRERRAFLRYLAPVRQAQCSRPCCR
jgi:hypothetical protein